MKSTSIKHIVFGASLTAMLLLGAGSASALGGATDSSSINPKSIDAILGKSAAAKANGDEFLPADEAFRFSAFPEGPDRVKLIWQIADGYYLYRARVKAATTSTQAQLGALEMPTGETKTDEYFGKQEIYHHELVASVPVAHAAAATQFSLPLKITYQGCATAGLCYPPITKEITVSLPSGITGGTPGAAGNSAANATGAGAGAPGFGSAGSGPAGAANGAANTIHGGVGSGAAGSGRAGSGLAGAGSGAANATAEGAGSAAAGSGASGSGTVGSADTISARTGASAVTASEAAGGEATGAAAASAVGSRAITDSKPAADTSSTGFVSEQDWFAARIRSGSLLTTLGWFFLAGLGLAFTPCVLPMVPILSSIIAGQGKNVTTGRGFALSLSYVLGMSLTYTVAGALCAAAGKQVQTVFQQPWILALFAAVFVAMALSMFGLFTVQMPAAIQTRIANLSNRQTAGTFGGVAIMGVLSALIVTTCVGPALVGALLVISQTGQIARGAAALFAMSIGMGTPLLLVGASAGKLLPKAGAWMDTVKKLFGVMMLAVADWMLARIVPDRASLLLWAIPALLGAWILWTHTRKLSLAGWVTRAAGVAAGLYGVALIAGAALGSTDPLSPLTASAASQQELPFRHIKSVADLQREIEQAKSQGRTVLVDFSAKWCVSCKEMEKYTFTDAAVKTALDRTVLLRADVTDNDAEDQALLKHLGVIGPPTIAFYGLDGQERPNYRVVGFMKAPDFASHAREALGG